ncbi:MAG: PrsW family intramembrane metalloprotease [Anaerolineae bacterium]
MANEFCCVCDAPIEGPVMTLGRRHFCERHYHHVTQDRKGVWNSTIVLVIALVIFALIVSALSSTLAGSLGGGGLIATGVVLALIPAVLWLAIFYLQDRLEPEPKGYVLGVFLLGALLARAVGQPLINGFFQVNEWASNSFAFKLAAGILIVGIIQEFLKYAAVRYSVFGSQEFDERVDGIVYGAAAGLGYATMLNIDYVIGSGGVDLGIGVMRIVVAALAHASFAGVSGYFLGRAKFENMGPVWLPGGLLLASVLNGVVTVALGAISRSGLQATPLNGLILAAIVAAITFGLLFTIIRRINQAVLAGAAH